MLPENAGEPGGNMESALISVFAFLAFYSIKSMLVNDLNPETAREMIREGAVIIDVRSEEEYGASNLHSAVNIPLPEISSRITDAVPDKEKVVMLHCRSGSRSLVGKRALKQMGYSNVYNLGSFSRAKKIASSM